MQGGLVLLRMDFKRIFNAFCWLASIKGAVLKDIYMIGNKAKDFGAPFALGLFLPIEKKV
jgi:hypothetical protein